MVLVLIAVIVLIVVDGILAPDGFSHIRGTYRTLRRTQLPAQAHKSTVCPTCRRLTKYYNIDLDEYQ